MRVRADDSTDGLREVVTRSNRIPLEQSSGGFLDATGGDIILRDNALQWGHVLMRFVSANGSRSNLIN